MVKIEFEGRTALDVLYEIRVFAESLAGAIAPVAQENVADASKTIFPQGFWPDGVGKTAKAEPLTEEQKPALKDVVESVAPKKREPLVRPKDSAQTNLIEQIAKAEFKAEAAKSLLPAKKEEPEEAEPEEAESDEEGFDPFGLNEQPEDEEQPAEAASIDEVGKPEEQEPEEEEPAPVVSLKAAKKAAKTAQKKRAVRPDDEFIAQVVASRQAAEEAEAEGKLPPSMPKVLTHGDKHLEVSGTKDPRTEGDCRAAIDMLCATYGIVAGQTLLAEFGVYRIAELEAKDYDTFVKSCHARSLALGRARRGK